MKIIKRITALTAAILIACSNYQPASAWLGRDEENKIILRTVNRMNYLLQLQHSGILSEKQFQREMAHINRSKIKPTRRLPAKARRNHRQLAKDKTRALLKLRKINLDREEKRSTLDGRDTERTKQIILFEKLAATPYYDLYSKLTSKLSTDPEKAELEVNQLNANPQIQQLKALSIDAVQVFETARKSTLSQKHRKIVQKAFPHIINDFLGNCQNGTMSFSDFRHTSRRLRKAVYKRNPNTPTFSWYNKPFDLSTLFT